MCLDVPLESRCCVHIFCVPVCCVSLNTYLLLLQQQKAAAEVREVENKRASLEKTLQTGIRDISSETTNTSTNSSQKAGYKRSPEDEEEEEFNMNRGSVGNGSGGKNNLLSEDIEGDSTEKRHQEAVIQVCIVILLFVKLYLEYSLARLCIRRAGIYSHELCLD